MESFLFAIDSANPEHWSYAVRDEIWDTTRRMVRNPISKGDLLYFWQSARGRNGGRIIGVAVARSGMEPRGDATMPWNVTDEKLADYKWRIKIQPLQTGSIEHLTWRDIAENTDTPPLQAPRHVPRNQEWLAKQVFGLSKAEQILSDLLGAVNASTGNWTDSVNDSPLNPEPVGSEDTRETAVRAIRLRQGQPQFRSLLLENYLGRCLVTGVSTEVLLDAAHITPYRGRHANVPWNGLLLRTDIHTLFDRYLLTLVPQDDTLVIRLDPDVDAEYQQYERNVIELSGFKQSPSPTELKIHNDSCEFLFGGDA